MTKYAQPNEQIDLKANCLIFPKNNDFKCTTVASTKEFFFSFYKFQQGKLKKSCSPTHFSSSNLALESQGVVSHNTMILSDVPF